MQIIVPIYVQQSTAAGLSAAVTARPLFHDSPVATAGDLGRTIAKLSQQLRKHFTDLARQSDYRQLIGWHQADAIDSQTLKLHLDLRDSTATLRILVVTVRRHRQLLAFSPNLPDLWFDIQPGESLHTRATAVYEAHFRQRSGEQPDHVVTDHHLDGKAWIDELAIDVLPSRVTKPPRDPAGALLGGDDVSDGADQLGQVGRCLNWLDTEELADPIAVDADVRQLTKLLSLDDRRGVVLVGPSGSGKTARIEGLVRRRIRRQRSGNRGQVWHLSPARLISGMSYLGQWQQRVLAILKHAHRHDHVLYFDDLLGLFESGKTRDSTMCVADTLRAQLANRPVRLIAEMTPEAWSIFRERDRAWADRLVVMPTEALDVASSMPILLGVRRRLEARYRCRFDLDVVPEVISMYDRFERSSVLPGKAAAALNRLAARAPHQSVTRSDAIDEFRSRSGLQPSIIDSRVKITRAMVVEKIRRFVVGQDEPVAALTDRVLIAAARMNDTQRPLGAFLLVGPTGVGKTQLAKAMADCLFDQGGLIRLDMNELSSADAASRLVGTFDAPDGLLTSAVRRRPHAVLLLDEIEKAHPAVLDVLLQALGEARLSDARGRTVNLSGLLILMTSNLGTRRSGRQSGFASGEGDQLTQVHDRAVQDFFRPEFFNRIDGVLHFHRLCPATIESIAWMQFQQILRRDGLQRRSVLIDLDPRAIQLAAARGFDPRLGARALKRQIERDLVRPAAEVLASSPSDQPTVLSVYLDDRGQIQTSWHSVSFARRQFATPPVAIQRWCQQVDAYLRRLAELIDSGPLRFEVNGRGVDPQLLERMTLRDTLGECQQQLRVLRELQHSPRLQRPQASPVRVPAVAGSTVRYEVKSRHGLRDLQAIDDIQDFLAESLTPLPSDQISTQRDRLAVAVGRLQSQLAARGTAVRWMLTTHWLGELSQPAAGVPPQSHSFRQLLATAIDAWACDQEQLVRDDSGGDGAVACYSGALARAALGEVVGGWMFVQPSGQIVVAEVQLHAITDGTSLRDAIRSGMGQHRQTSTAAVRRVLRVDGPQVDLVSGAAVHQPLSSDAVVRLLSAARQARPVVLDMPDLDTATLDTGTLDAGTLDAATLGDGDPTT